MVLRFAMFNMEVTQAAIRIAKQEGLSVSLDLASFEVFSLKLFHVNKVSSDQGSVYLVCMQMKLI